MPRHPLFHCGIQFFHGDHCRLAFEKIFQAVGKMAVSMFSMMCGCILNIILDPVMIFGLDRFRRWD